MNPHTILSIYYVCMYVCMYSMFTCIYVYFRNISIHRTTKSSHTQVGSMYACMNFIIVERLLRILKRILYCVCMYVWHVWHRRWVRVSGSCTLLTAHAACSLFLVRSGCTLSWRTCAPPRTRWSFSGTSMPASPFPRAIYRWGGHLHSSVIHHVDIIISMGKPLYTYCMYVLYCMYICKCIFMLFRCILNKCTNVCMHRMHVCRVCTVYVHYVFICMYAFICMYLQYMW